MAVRPIKPFTPDAEPPIILRGTVRRPVRGASMRRRLGLALITSCALVLWSGTALAQQYPPEDPEASVTLVASSYAPGDTVSGVGEGCLSSEEGAVWLLCTPQLITVV